MLVYTENHETAAQRAITTTHRSGGKPHREGIFYGWDTVSTVFPNTIWEMHT